MLGRCRGGFLLSQPDVALDIVRRVHDAVGRTHPVTVKLRRGMDDTPESGRNFLRIIDGALAIGVSALTVHGRTVVQRYKGPSDWSFLAKIKKRIGDAVMFGSGDLFSAEACVNMIRETGVDGVTIARGCIGNPWIFENCRALWRGDELPPPPSILQQRDAIAGHWADMVDHYGTGRAGKLMRKFGIKYSRHHPHVRQVRDAFISVSSPDDIKHVLEAWYDPQIDWPAVDRPRLHDDLIAAGATP